MKNTKVDLDADLTLPKYKCWTIDALECYLRGCNCEGCPMADIIHSLEAVKSCKMKTVVMALITRGTKPPVTHEEAEKMDIEQIKEFVEGKKNLAVISKFRKFRVINHYRQANEQERRCGMCVYLRCKKTGKRKYYKCEKMGVSNSNASDIYVSYVCDNFSEKEQKNEDNT